MDDKIFDQIQQVDLKKTMETSYIDYAMSVIASRALPDVRDGLKPVQRRQPQPGADLLGQRVELLCGKGGQILPGVGGRLADIPQCRHQRRTEFVSQCLPALVGVEDEVAIPRYSARSLSPDNGRYDKSPPHGRYVVNDRSTGGQTPSWYRTASLR